MLDISTRPYRKFSDYLKKKYSCKVYRLSIDAGFSCPNLDGTKDTRGCSYCSNSSFNLNRRPGRNRQDIKSQIEYLMEFNRKRYKAEKFFLYFQTFSNTHAGIEDLKRNYDVIYEYDDIVGLAIATRPDCVDENKLELISSYGKKYEVWLEYGIQSMHQRTLDRINRNHDIESFRKAVEITSEYGLNTAVHVILGLPGENRGNIISTAKQLSLMKIQGLKLHPLHIVKGTELEKLYNEQNLPLMSMEEYADTVCEFIGYTPPELIVMRLTADCPEELLIAPDWIKNKNKLLNIFDEKMLKSGSFQGMYL